jgi:hypothetical protein
MGIHGECVISLPLRVASGSPGSRIRKTFLLVSVEFLLEDDEYA